MFRTLPAFALALFLLPAAAQALPATVPAPAAPAPVASDPSPLETAWAWLTALFAPSEGTVVGQRPPMDELDGALYNFVPTFYEGSHLDPNGG